MENLRETLKLLFLRQDCRLLVRSIHEGEPSMARQVDSRWFVHEFPNTIASYSYDQKAQIHRLMCEKWMRDDGKFKDLSFSSIPTIFNVLHYFTGQCLREEGGELLCDYESLLRWHDLSSRLSEDLLITSYYAGKDLKAGATRTDFAWAPIIGHNNEKLNEILAQPLSDLHFHLLGSSFHFDISWLSVMNYPEGALEMYKKEAGWQPRKGEGINKYVNLDELFVLLIKACAIRRYLYHWTRGTSNEEEYNNLVNDLMGIDEKGEEEIESPEFRPATGIMSAIPGLQGGLKGDIEAGFRYSRDDSDKQFVVDYALTDDLVNVIEKKNSRYIYTVLAGERHLMYVLYRKIYEGTAEQIERIEMLYYAYLMIKGLVRHELVQLNSEIGLMNFTEFDGRKITFARIKNDYTDLMKQMAIRSFCERNNENYLEVRVQTKDDVKELKGLIKDVDKNVNNQWFCESNDDKNLNFWYVLNFIKKADEVSEEQATAQCRHQELREQLRVQSKASYEWKYREGNEEPNRVVGIDAANTECYCRPEVFAEAFRFLRHHKPTEERPGIKDYSFTYHVGEDFYDIADGLRAIDETLRFLEFKKGDRLGHALALGVDVKKYYRGCSQTVVMQKQLLLDNAAWLIKFGELIDSFGAAKKELAEVFASYYSYIYNIFENADDYKTYYDSWLLRGDNPTGYKEIREGKPVWGEATEWSAYELTRGEEYDNARSNPLACTLNQRYHYDVGVKRRGGEAGELKISFELVKFIEEVQRKMLKKVADIEVSIECCPTSNLRIGPIHQYREHPIFRFNGTGLDLNGKTNWELPVSVNTDDKGIFSTSLEREYSLLCSALSKDAHREETKNSPEMIYSWIEMIRQFGNSLKFGGA